MSGKDRRSAVRQALGARRSAGWRGRAPNAERLTPRHRRAPNAERRAPKTQRRAPALLILLALAGCEWFTDFKDQPKIEPWEAEYRGDKLPFPGNPQFSVPVSGAGVPGYVVSYQPLPLTVDSMSGLDNPVPPTDSSLEVGRLYYQINCAVCHGATGAGNGPATKYGVPAPNLLTPITRNRTDGYLYGIIRNGRGLMPNYNRIEDRERWDVVNYVRALQGRLKKEVSTQPAGAPGEGGEAVPGYTRTAPTVPAPYRSSSAGPRRDAATRARDTTAVTDTTAADTTAGADTAVAADRTGTRPVAVPRRGPPAPATPSGARP